VNRIKYFIEQSWLLIVSSFFFGLLIAVTSSGLSPRIRQNEINKRNQLASVLLPDAKDFIPLDVPIGIQSHGGKKENIEVYKAVSQSGEVVGWCFEAVGSGFQDKIKLVVALDSKLDKIAGYDVLSSNETPGFGDRIKNNYYRDQFKGAPAVTLKLVTVGNPDKIDSEIVAISGATISSEAVVDIINNYVSQVKEQLLKKRIIGNGKQ
jgi:electron transport complex protein RnfG